MFIEHRNRFSLTDLMDLMVARIKMERQYDRLNTYRKKRQLTAPFAKRIALTDREA